VAPLVVLSLVGGGFVLAGVRAATDNFYLIDRARHIVYFHVRFLWFRRVRALLTPADIYATSAQSKKVVRGGAAHRWMWITYWLQRPVVIDRHGRVTPMADWQRDALWTANNQAKEIAQALGCQWLETPEQAQLVVRMKDGTPQISFRHR